MISTDIIVPLVTPIRTEAYIDGAFGPAASGATMPVYNPATGRVIADVAACAAADIDRAVAAARAVFERGDWSRAHPAHRRRVLTRFAELMERHTEDLAQLDSLEAGKPITDCREGDIPESVETFRWFAEAIDKVFDRVAPTGIDVGRGAAQDEPESELPTGPPGGSGEPAEPEEPAGGYEPDTIVVLTDGANSAGVDPVTAAAQAAERRVRVYTIGFGTTQPAQMVCTAEQIGSDSRFGGGRGFGGGRRGRIQQIDEPTLTAVADLTGGEYYRAQDAGQLNDVLLDLPKTIVTQEEDVELTVWFALAGVVLVGSAVGLSLWWSRPRPRR